MHGHSYGNSSNNMATSADGIEREDTGLNNDHIMISLDRGSPSIYQGEGPSEQVAPKRGMAYYTSYMCVTV